MTKEEVAKMAVESYLQALIDTHQVLNEFMQNTINSFKEKIREMEKKND